MLKTYFKSTSSVVFIVTLLAASLVQVASAKTKNVWQDKKGTIHASTTWQKSKNNFGAMLLPVKDVEAFEKAWYRPASKDYTPKIHVIDVAKIDEIITMLLMFSGCVSHKNDECRVYGTITIKNPKNKVVYTQKVDFYKDQQPADRIMTVSPVRIGFSIDKDEPLGKYTFEYTVIDSAKNTTLELARTVVFTQ